jgi:glutamate---cysteine ligase / carboxylate-amine ligase
MSQLAGPLDVRDHHFGASAPFTVGIEEEFMLLHPGSFDLAPGAARILEAERDSAYAKHIAPELFDSLVEFHTGVCSTVAEAAAEIRLLRRHAVLAARRQQLRLASAGTHPFSRFEEQPLTPNDRYHALVHELQYAVRRELIYGLHVHVGIDDPDRAIHVVNALRAHLCELVALSANSPFWRGAATGHASCRHMIFSAFPRSGPPPEFASFDEYATVIEQLVDSGSLEDYTRTWWDVRPHPRLGTIEVRVMDAVTRVDDTIALAAFVQSLVHHHAGRSAGRCHPVLAEENKWRAARYGLDATVSDPGGRGPVRLRDVIERTLDAIAPSASALGCERELTGIERILRTGNGASRQLETSAATGDTRAIARDIAARTEV